MRAAGEDGVVLEYSQRVELNRTGREVSLLKELREKVGLLFESFENGGEVLVQEGVFPAVKVVDSSFLEDLNHFSVEFSVLQFPKNIVPIEDLRV